MHQYLSSDLEIIVVDLLDVWRRHRQGRLSPPWLAQAEQKQQANRTQINQCSTLVRLPSLYMKAGISMSTHIC
jgi:hypothetical protein